MGENPKGKELEESQVQALIEVDVAMEGETLEEAALLMARKLSSIRGATVKEDRK